MAKTRFKLAPQMPLRVGVIGAGFMGKEHIKGVREIIRRGLLSVELAGIGSVNHEKGRATAKEHGCAYYEGGEALIADAAIDAVVIATPTREHLPLVKLAARAGKAVFLEKPMGRNLAEASKAAEILSKSRAPHQVGLVLRFSPTYNVLKKLLEDPANGEFIFCRFRDDQFFPIRSVYDSDWRRRVEVAGGGALIEHSIHDVDVINWFFGEPELTDAMILPSSEKGIEKLAALGMKFKRGGRAHLSSVWHHNLGRENERHIEIFFENRFFLTDGGFTSPIRVQGPKGPIHEISSEEVKSRFLKIIGWRDPKNADFPMTVGYEMYVFLKNVLEGRKQSAVGAGVGLAAHRVIETAYRMGKRR
ncbi:Gfo/Idh/MocA family oxidoreductase [Candidatus Sumerlaeota bacterium]|nr:Gfo/Idh/MocA family oxidoreductase [Candidatus Sumerlaeota bacterium]MBI3734943.1 Gfo/Idh/MocA family oxidoreductase [Candidatus Sumerlaeota bacterium]